ncbi:MAG: hypothetical protein JNM79_25170 [Burkholderiales bacterium]|nr:hypothetical protein [Burkholderiales bacterium]
MDRRLRAWLPLVLLALMAAAPVAAQKRDQPMPGDYRVVDGRVDRGTYAGWRVFHSACHACHGVGGGGTDLAPNLLTRIGGMTPRAFAARVLASYRLVAPEDDTASGAATPDTMLEQIMRRERGSGARVIMPAWESDPQVSPHVLDLYAYLSARADGRIGTGQPRREGAGRR